MIGEYSFGKIEMNSDRNGNDTGENEKISEGGNKPDGVVCIKAFECYEKEADESGECE